MAKRNENAVQIKKDADNPEPDEVIAKAIIDLSDGAERLLKGPLKRKAILLLLKSLTGVPMDTINSILDALPRLRDEFTK